MLSTRLRIIVCILSSFILPFSFATAQQCAPCLQHCEQLGQGVNAACVKAGLEPGGIPGICYKNGQKTKTGCLANCYICEPSTVHPDFLLISVLYAPPGNASSAAFGQSTSSGATYGIGTNISEASGTSVSITESFSSPSPDSSGGGKSLGGYSVNLQSSSSSGSGSTGQFSAVTTSTSTDNLKSSKDLLDHTQDIFLLWLNPVVTLTKSDQATLAAAITSGDAEMSVQTVSAYQLINGIPAEKLSPTKICPTTPSSCFTLPGLGSLTKDDISSILAQDTFLNAAPNQTPDPSRFIYLQSNTLENTTVAAGTTQTFTVSDAQTTGQTLTQTSGSTEGVTTGISALLSPIGISFAQTGSWTWSQTVSRGSSSGQTQQASVTLSSTTQSCCGINSATCEVGVWEDMVYRTFVFVPQPETCQVTAMATPSPAAAVSPSAAQPKQTMLAARSTGSFTGPPLRGTVTRGGAALKGVTVIISNETGEVLYRIVTDHLGHYFSGAIAPGTVKVRVGTRVLQTAIKAGHGALLDVEL